METKFLVIDIETVPICKWDELPENLKQIWYKKTDKRFTEYDTFEQKYNHNASSFSLFSKIICISVSFCDSSNIKSYIGDESIILNHFANDLILILNKFKIKIIGHNILAFDLPFILHRSLINKISIPCISKIINCKSWDIPAFDTMIMWKCTSNEWYSLEYICECLHIESPKNKMKGDQVAAEYYKDNIKGIKNYCEKNVMSTKQIFNILFNQINL